MLRVIHTSRSPFELWLLAAALVSGIGGLAMPGSPSRVTAGLPPWAQIVWYAGLAVSGALGMTGAMSSRLWSLYVERGALVMLAGLLTVYTVAIVATVKPSLAFGAVLTASLIPACVVRVRQINADVRHVLEGDGNDG